MAVDNCKHCEVWIIQCYMIYMILIANTILHVVIALAVDANTCTNAKGNVWKETEHHDQT